MAIAHGSTSFNTGTAANPVGTEPTGSANGNLLLALVIHEAAPNTITAPAGWNTLYEGGSPTTSPLGSGFRYWVGWIIRGASAPALTWTSTESRYYEVHIERLTGSFDSGSIDASASGTTYNGSAAPNPPSATATGAADMALALAVHWNGSNGGWTAPSGYTLRSNNTSGNDGIIATKLLSASGAEDPGAFSSGSLGASDAWNGATILVKEAAPVGPSGSASITGGGNITATGSATPTIGGSASISGGGGLAASVRKGAVSSPAATPSLPLLLLLESERIGLSGGGDIVASGSQSFGASGSASISGGGSLAAVGRKGALGSALLSGGGNLTALGTALLARSGSASISGGGDLVALGRKTASGLVVITGGGSILVVGTAATASSGAASVSGGGQLSTSGQKSVSGSASTSGGGGLVASAKKGAFTVALISSGGDIATVGIVGFAFSGSASISGGGQVTTTPSGKAVRGQAQLSGDGDLVTQARKAVPGALVLSGGGDASVSGLKASAGAVLITGGGSLQVVRILFGDPTHLALLVEALNSLRLDVEPLNTLTLEVMTP